MLCSRIMLRYNRTVITMVIVMAYVPWICFILKALPHKCHKLQVPSCSSSEFTITIPANAITKMDRYLIRKRPSKDYSKEKELEDSENDQAKEKKSRIEEEVLQSPTTSAIVSEESETEEKEDSGGTETVRKNKKKSYQQKFKEGWVRQFGSWLSHTTESDVKKAYCKVCNKILHGGITHIKRHANSSLHCNNLKAAKARPSVTIDTLLTNPKEEALCKQIKSAELKMVMFLADHNLPFSLLDHLGKFLASTCPDSTVAKSLSCQRKKGTNLCVNVIAPCQLQAIAKDLNENYFSIIVDETTDVSVTKSLVVVARYYKDYKVVDRYLSLIEVKDGSAEGLYQAIKNFFSRSNINIKNMIGFAADNASVMQGEKNGLKAKFKDLLPHLFVLGCVCHSFNLCSSAACSKLPRNVEKFCRDICNYFSHSSVRQDKFIEFQEFCKTEPHRLLNLSQTRWLSLQVVVDRILEQWQPLILFFTSECSHVLTTDRLNKDTADMILSALKNPIFKLYFLFLSYSLDLINMLNIEFQSEGLKVHCLLEKITVLYTTILKNFIKEKCIIDEHLDSLDVGNPRNFLELENIYFGAQCELLILELKDDIDSTDLKNFRLRCLEFYVELAKQIQNRFSFADEVLTFAKILDPEVVFSKEFPSIVPVIHRFPVFCPNEDLEKANTEWRLLKESKNLFVLDSDVEHFWKQVFTMKNGVDEPMFGTLKTIISGLICLPHSSAAAERIFSQLQLIKTKHRNRLRITTCDALLQAKEMLRGATCFNFVPSDSLLNKTKRHQEDTEEAVDVDITF